MIGYITLGTNDMQRSAAFYDEFLKLFSAKRVVETEKMILWSNGKPGRSGLSIIKPYDKNAATPGNGTMVALGMDSPEKIGEAHKKAISLGAQDEGAPGLRSGNFYGAYFRDLDGNKICLFCVVKQ